jgi:hypothetical protein
MVTRKLADFRTMRFLCAILWVQSFSLCDGALPSDPDNAALVYYQAFLLWPEPDATTKELIERVANGADPNEQTRDYVKGCRTAIRYAQMAVRIPRCDWGLWYSLGFRYSLPHLESARFLCRILQVDARVLAADGDFRGAIGRCLVIRGLAKHIGIETYASYAAAMGIERRAQSTICHILGSKAHDPNDIIWLKEQLAATPPVSRSVTRAAQMDLEMALQNAADNGGMQRIRQQIAREDGESAKDILELSDEKLLTHIRKEYMGFLDAALGVIDSNMAYGRTRAELQSLVDALQKKGSNAIVRAFGVVLGNALIGSYDLQVRNAARLAAFSIALDLYLEKARTGRPPERLPDGLPKDPENAEDFLYTLTQGGFALSSRYEPHGGLERLHLEYKVR